MKYLRKQLKCLKLFRLGSHNSCYRKAKTKFLRIEISSERSISFTDGCVSLNVNKYKRSDLLFTYNINLLRT